MKITLDKILISSIGNVISGCAPLTLRKALPKRK